MTEYYLGVLNSKYVAVKVKKDWYREDWYSIYSLDSYTVTTFSKITGDILEKYCGFKIFFQCKVKSRNK